MKSKIVMIIIGLLACFSQSAIAQEKGEIKKRLTAEYLEFIKEEGYSPTIDEEGDVKFKVEGRNHYIIVYDEESPQYVVVMVNSGFSIKGENALDRTKCLIATNEVNRGIRGVQIYISETSVNICVGMAYTNTESFRGVFYKILAYLESGRDRFIKEYNKLNDTPSNNN